MIIVKLF